jgi:hypothetical protein
MRVFACLLFLSIATVSNAQWSSDPAVNLSIADGTDDAGNPKVAPIFDGCCYISWFESSADGYDVRLQKLDASGYEMFPHNGILVGESKLTWTQDYGLDVDAFGNALLAFVDYPGGRTRITAAKVSPGGALLWGASGVQLTDTTASVVYVPKIAGTSDGGSVIAWTEGSAARLQKLDADGNPLWGDGITLSPATGSYSARELRCSGTDCILSLDWYTGDVHAPIYLLAQKFSSDGALLWGADPITIYDASSLPVGDHSGFMLDGSGGAVFNWCAFSPEPQCYIQHVRADGAEAFAHNGVAVSTNMMRARASQSAAFNPFTNETFVFWVEMTLDQTFDGFYGQKLDANGNRQWTDEGLVIEPIGSEELGQVRCLLEGARAFVFWNKAPAWGQSKYFGACLNSAGEIDISPFSVASDPSNKSGLAAARSRAGYMILAWSDKRPYNGDILVQNVNRDGTLGNNPATDVAVECVTTPSVLLEAPYPNPANRFTRIDYSVAAQGEIVLEIYDVRGSMIRTWNAGAGPRSGSFVWDTRDNAGARVGCGLYFVRIRNGETVRTARLVIIR